MICFTDFVEDLDARHLMGFVTIGMIGLILAIGLCQMITSIVLDLKKRLKQFCVQKPKKQFSELHRARDE